MDVQKENTNWSLDLLVIKSIPIRIHYSFFLLPAYVFLGSSQGGVEIAKEMLFLILMFSCISLHELGHALMARRFGIETRDTVLYPFGGIATILGNTSAKSELFVALAGPAVNVVIALLLFPFSDFYSSTLSFPGHSIITQLFIANIVLVIFNLIPALPMDGGRVLRSALLLFGVRSATLISCRISQILSVLLLVASLYTSNIILSVISVLIFTQATQELMNDRTKTAIRGVRVSDLMIRRENIETLAHGMAVSDALACVMKSFQDYFPVLHGDEVVGVIDREDILHAAALGERTNYIAEFMNRSFPKVHPSDLLIDVMSSSIFRGGTPVFVYEGPKFAGILLKEAVSDLLFLDGFQKKKAVEE